jgi:hypothetical protein
MANHWRLAAARKPVSAPQENGHIDGRSLPGALAETAPGV